MAQNSSSRTAEKSTTRISVTFTPEQYGGLVEQANAKKVSVAWVVRDAVDHYLQSELPLFFQDGHRREER